MDQRLAIGMAKHAHATFAAGRNNAVAAIRRYIHPLYEKMTTPVGHGGRQRKRATSADIDRAVDGLMGEFTAVYPTISVADQPGGKSRDWGMVYLTPVDIFGRRMFSAVAVAKHFSTRRIASAVQAYPLTVANHVLERYAERTNNEPASLFAESRLTDAMLLAAAMTFHYGRIPLADRPCDAMSVQLPYGDHILLAYVRPYYESDCPYDAGLIIDRHRATEMEVFNWARNHDAMVEITTFVSDRLMWPAQVKLNSVLNEYVNKHRKALTRLHVALAMSINAALTGEVVMLPDMQQAIDELAIVMDSGVWREAVRQTGA